MELIATLSTNSQLLCNYHSPALVATIFFLLEELISILSISKGHFGRFGEELGPWCWKGFPIYYTITDTITDGTTRTPRELKRDWKVPHKETRDRCVSIPGRETQRKRSYSTHDQLDLCVGLIPRESSSAEREKTYFFVVNWTNFPLGVLLESCDKCCFPVYWYLISSGFLFYDISKYKTKASIL